MDHYSRKLLVEILVYHQATSTSGCICGWHTLGASHPEHIADVYEAARGVGNASHDTPTGRKVRRNIANPS